MADTGRAARVFAAWYEAQEQGAAVAPSRLVEAHPDIADDLRARLSALDIVDDVLRIEYAAAPKQIGPYRLLRALGSGGMGSVHLAEAVEAAGALAKGDRLALKLLHPHLLERPGFFRRFLREADLGRRVEHDNVVRTYIAGALVVDGRSHHFLVMEYVAGKTLGQLVEELDRLPESLCRHVAAEVAKGLGAIHAVGAVHRDLKPDNVLITDDHVVKVMDLGVARLMDETLRLSQTGAFVGSLSYAAPEQFGGDAAVDARADLHALGVLLYEIASGVHPYDDDDARVVMRRILDEPPRPLGDANPQLSPFFEELVHTLLAKSPGERFESADAFLGVLDEAEHSTWWHDRARALRAATRQPLRRIRIPRETAVHGRDADLDRLAALYRAAKAGDGRVLLLEGEAGIGKTRLIDEFVSRLTASGEDVNFLFASYPPGGAATASGAFSAAYRRHLGDGDLEQAVGRVLPETPLMVPAFAALLRGDAAPADAVRLDKGSLQSCFVHATRSLAAERTTIVLIDDLHFAPDEGRALFSSVALAVPGHRVLLIGTMRPGVPEEWTADVVRLDQTTHSVLERLGPKDLFGLLADSFRSQRLAEELGMRISVKSDGNPFFVFEIIRGLRDGQFLRQRPDGTWETTQIIEDIEIPSSVLDLVNARVAALSERERHLLDVAACWGFEFDPALVADVLGTDRVSVLQALAHLEKRHHLVRSAGRRFVFDHHQVQEALYQALPELLREEYHAALAEALERRTNAAELDPGALAGDLVVDLCDHFLSGARGERAVRYVHAALTHLENGYVYDRALALVERVLAVPGLLEGAERARVLLRPTTVLDLLGRVDQLERYAQEADRLARESGDDEAGGHAAKALGMVCWRSRRYDEAKTHHRRAIEIARSRGDLVAEAGGTVNLGLAFDHEDRFAEARELYERGLNLSRRAGHRRFEATAIGNLGILCHSQAQYDAARPYFEEALAISREIGDRSREARNLGNLAKVHHAQGRLDESRRLYEQSIALARDTGNRVTERMATGDLGNLFRTQGRLLDARACFERAWNLSREMNSVLWEAIDAGRLGTVAYAEGDLDRARRRFERQHELAREHDLRGESVVALLNLGPTLLALGQVDAARDVLSHALVPSREQDLQNPTGYALHGLASVADERGDLAGALRLSQQALDLRREIERPAGVLESLLQRADLLRRAGEYEDASEAGREAVELSRAQGREAQLVHGLALLAAVPGGDVTAAETALSQARDRGLGTWIHTRLSIHHLLWTATRTPAHAAEAKAVSDEMLALVPAEHHDAMRRDLRVHREILAAWKEHGEAPGGPSESATRAV